MDTEIIETTEVPTQSVAIRETQVVAPTGLFGSAEPVQVITRATEVATALKSVIAKQGLISKISGREYPKCEAWTLLGTMLGVFPVLTWTKPVDGGWEARVEARTKAGDVIGAAEAQCLRSERNWKDRDDFAIRSMAQTRATAKCLRMPLGFVMTLAGYEATPAEEMDHPSKPAPQPQRQQPTPQPTRAPAPAPAQEPVEPAKPKPVFATPAFRARLIEELQASPGMPNRELVTEYFRLAGQILPNEDLEELPLRWCPINKEQMLAIKDKLAGFGNGEQAAPAFPPNQEAPPTPQPKKAATPKSQGQQSGAGQNQTTTIPSVTHSADGKIPAEQSESIDEPWRSFPMPFGKQAGVKLADLPKNYLFGLWANYKVETEYNGKPKKPETIAKDTQFREMLDAAGVHYKFEKKD